MSREDTAANLSEGKIEKPDIKIMYPQVTNMKQRKAENKINETIKEKVYKMLKEIDYYRNEKYVLGEYFISNNKNGILSLTLKMNCLDNDECIYSLIKSMTFCLKNGRLLKFKDLFSSNRNYVTRISQIIRNEFNDRDIPIIAKFRTIEGNPDFYLSENELIVYFQQQEYTPIWFGTPEFRISYANIYEYIKEKGPIDRIIEGNMHDC